MRLIMNTTHTYIAMVSLISKGLLTVIYFPVCNKRVTKYDECKSIHSKTIEEMNIMKSHKEEGREEDFYMLAYVPCNSM